MSKSAGAKKSTRSPKKTSSKSSGGNALKTLRAKIVALKKSHTTELKKAIAKAHKEGLTAGKRHSSSGGRKSSSKSKSLRKPAKRTATSRSKSKSAT